ncbi:hypothetical protein EMPG_12923, partial [Blastomyces silverae]
TGGKEPVAIGAPKSALLSGLNIYWVVESSKLSRAPLEGIVSIRIDGRKESRAIENRLSRTKERERKKTH